MPSRYETELFKLVRQPTHDLQLLKTHWPAIKADIDKVRRRLSKKIDKDDPILFRVDLITPLGCISNETIHTQALSYLLNPDKEHGFGRSVITSLVESAEKIRSPGSAGATAALKLLRKRCIKISVASEFRYAIEDGPGRRIARCDIWITLTSQYGNALIVIENKINAPESFGQLKAYAREAGKWRRKHHGPSLLIYLAPKARLTELKNGRWISLSYLDLASALRKAWLKHPRAAGRRWLGLYIAAIAQGVLGFDVNRIENTDVADLKTYLGDLK